MPDNIHITPDGVRHHGAVYEHTFTLHFQTDDMIGPDGAREAAADLLEIIVQFYGKVLPRRKMPGDDVLDILQIEVRDQTFDMKHFPHERATPELGRLRALLAEAEEPSDGLEPDSDLRRGRIRKSLEE